MQGVERLVVTEGSAARPRLPPPSAGIAGTPLVDAVLATPVLPSLPGDTA